MFEDRVDHLLEEEGDRHVDDRQRDADRQSRGEQRTVRPGVRQKAPDLGPGSPFSRRWRGDGGRFGHGMPQATDAGRSTVFRAPSRIIWPLRHWTPVASRTSSIPRRLLATMPETAPTVYPRSRSQRTPLSHDGLSDAAYRTTSIVSLNVASSSRRRVSLWKMPSAIS